MSCRQSSPPEAPDGQKYIPWCLPAFVLEKPLQAPLVPFWRQLPRQVKEGGSPTEEGLPSPSAVRKQSAEGQEEKEGEGGESDSIFCLGLGSWGPWQWGHGYPQGWRVFSMPTMVPQSMKDGGLGPHLFGLLRKEQLSI